MDFYGSFSWANFFTQAIIVMFASVVHIDIILVECPIHIHPRMLVLVTFITKRLP